jgi:hypothetical protein
VAKLSRTIFLNRADHAPKLRDTADATTTDGYVLTWDQTNLGWYASDAGSGGTSAPSDAQYVTLSAHSGLPNERLLAGVGGVKISDGGAGENVSLALGFPSGDTTGDMLLRSGTGYERLAKGVASNVLQVSSVGTVEWNKPKTPDPMVWVSGELCYKRDGVRVLATIPYDASAVPLTTSYEFQAVLSAASGGTTVRVKLYNATAAAYISGATLTTTSSGPTNLAVSLAAIGTAGGLPASLATYEVHAEILGENNSDMGIVGFVGLSMQ